jgi:hypothetical protein
MQLLVVALSALFAGSALALECERGFTLFDNILGREDRPTCIKLVTANAISNAKNHATFCTRQHSRAYPLTWEEPLPASNNVAGSMINALWGLIATEEVSNTVTDLILVGGQQTGSNTKKNAQWKW